MTHTFGIRLLFAFLQRLPDAQILVKKGMQNMVLLPEIMATGGDPPERMSSTADQTLFVAALVLLGVVFVLLFLLRKHNETAKQLQVEIKKHWQIYELMNLYFFEYEYAADQLTVFEPSAEKGEPNQRKVYSQVSTNGQVPFAHLLADFLRRKQNGVHEVLLPFGGHQCWLQIAMCTELNENGLPVYTIGRIANIDQQKKEREELEKKAQRDSLTGLLNNASTRVQIEHLVQKLEGEEQGALILMDIDFFKEVNDGYGHMRGDKVLIQVAEVLRENFRPGDVIGRPGGDEFLIYMRGVQEMVALAERCGRLCRRIRGLSGEGLHLSVSIGAAVAGPGAQYDLLYERADRALYRAKAAGRDRFHIVPWCLPGTSEETHSVNGGV